MDGKEGLNISVSVALSRMRRMLSRTGFHIHPAGTAGVVLSLCFLSCASLSLTTLWGFASYGEEMQAGEAGTLAMPDIILYEELEPLVKAYSPQIQMEQSRYDSRLARYENAKNDILETRRLLREEADDLEDEGDKDSAGQYRAQAKTLEEAAKDMDKQIRSAQGSSSVMSLRRMEDTVLWTAQNLMSTYNTLKMEQEAAAAQAEWKQSQYEKLLRQVQTGSAAQVQADEAGKAAAAAAERAKAARDEMERVKKELLILTGYPQGAQTEIGPMPVPQAERVRDMGGDSDKWRALGNNYSLREQRSGGASSNKELHSRQRDIRQSEEEMYGQMDTLYQDVLANHTRWNSACTSMASQEEAFKAASNKMALGMMSRQEYLEAKAAYMDAVAAKGRADAGFQQAMDTYDWALKGFMM